jgi:hypothetical protein
LGSGTGVKARSFAGGEEGSRWVFAVSVWTLKMCFCGGSSCRLGWGQRLATRWEYFVVDAMRSVSEAADSVRIYGGDCLEDAGEGRTTRSRPTGGTGLRRPLSNYEACGRSQPQGGWALPGELWRRQALYSGRFCASWLPLEVRCHGEWRKWLGDVDSVS